MRRKNIDIIQVSETEDIMVFPTTLLPKHRDSSQWPIWCLLVLLLLTACSSGQGSSSNSSTLQHQSLSGPSPVATVLDPAPQNCPSGPPLSTKPIPGYNALAIGSGAVWESGLPPNTTLNLNELRYTPWPGTKILWPTEANFPATVMVRVTNLKTGSEAWWDVGEGDPPPNKPVRPLILNSKGNKTGGPFLWGTFLYLPQAGCYKMAVSWPGGQWQLIFAAGR